MRILYKYPKKFKNNDGKEFIVRPLRKEDEKPLFDYFNRFPKKDVIWMKNNLFSDLKVVESWIYDLDYDKILPLIAIIDDKIATVGTLHFSPIGWTKHQAEVRITSDPEYRKKGMASIVINDIVDLAIKTGLEQLTAETSPHLHKAFFLFEKLGFKEAGLLKNFLKDPDGNYEDLVLMVKDLTETE